MSFLARRRRDGRFRLMESAANRLGVGVGRLGAIAGRRRSAEGFAALALAADAGVRLIDCPPEPRAAERLVGEVLAPELGLQVVTRTAEVPGGPGAVARRLRNSLRSMRLESAHAVLVRAPALAEGDGMALWTTLLRIRDEGVVGRVGIAACVCDDPAALARRFRPDLMQLPLSLLDQRMLSSGALDAVAAAGVEVHLRSILMHDLDVLDEGDGKVTPLSPQVGRLRRVLAEAGA